MSTQNNKDDNEACNAPMPTRARHFKVMAGGGGGGEGGGRIRGGVQKRKKVNVWLDSKKALKKRHFFKNWNN